MKHQTQVADVSSRSTSHLSQQPCEPAYYIVDCRISLVHFSFLCCRQKYRAAPCLAHANVTYYTSDFSSVGQTTTFGKDWWRSRGWMALHAQRGLTLAIPTNTFAIHFVWVLSLGLWWKRNVLDKLQYCITMYYYPIL